LLLKDKARTVSNLPFGLMVVVSAVSGALSGLVGIGMLLQELLSRDYLFIYLFAYLLFYLKALRYSYFIYRLKDLFFCCFGFYFFLLRLLIVREWSELRDGLLVFDGLLLVGID
jgi:hypothetical protein